MTAYSESESPSVQAWYCVRSQPKHEHIAAAHLRSQGNMEVLVPRIRFQRPTKFGPAWITEALFPNYFFARFDRQTSLRLVVHAGGVSGVVHFGPHWPTVPDSVIADLRTILGTEEVHVIDASVNVGEHVKIIGGGFHDFEGGISAVMPSRQRVAVLLDFLGRQTPVEVSMLEIAREADQRKGVLG